MGGVYPISAYSRVVSISLGATSTLPPQVDYTPVLGNRIWLLGIKAWVAAKAIDSAQYTTLSFWYGYGKPTTQAAMQEWRELIPFGGHLVPRVPWYFYDGDLEKSWDFSMLFVGESKRFGIIADRNVADANAVQVSFIISEG